LLSVLSHDRGCRLQADPNGAAFVDKGALSGNSRLTTSSAVNIGGIPLPPQSVRRLLSQSLI
jgi:hypothetical protein